MTKIIDPDGLVRSSTLANIGVDGNIWIDTATKTFSLASYGDLSTDGVSVQAIYSYLKEEWKTDVDLIKYPFPMVAITPEQFEYVDGWKPADANTVNLFRDGGFAIKNTDGSSAEEYVGVITLGEIGASDQVYFQQVDGGSATNVVLTGAVNQCVKVYGDGAGQGIDNATATDTRTYFKIFVREYQKLYAQSQLADIGVSQFTYQAYRFPLANSADLKITHDDSTVSSALPYTDMSITYYATPQSRTIGASSYDFDIIIDADVANDGNLPTAEEIYEFVQYSLRQDADIDDGSGTVNGKTASGLLQFVGDTLVTSTGVFIDDFSETDINRIEFYDTSGTKRVFPFVAAGSINFNDNLVSDSGAIYRMFFTDANGNNFGDSDAIIVQNNDDVDIAGDVTGSQVQFTFDYDGNVQGGRTAGTDAPVTVVAIGLDKAQYVKATGTIGRTNANSISLVASLERNYSNPA
jgi:hypothetical protein